MATSKAKFMYKVNVIAHQLKDGKLANFGTVISERQLNGNAADLLKNGFIVDSKTIDESKKAANKKTVKVSKPKDKKSTNFETIVSAQQLHDNAADLLKNESMGVFKTNDETDKATDQSTGKVGNKEIGKKVVAKVSKPKD